MLLARKLRGFFPVVLAVALCAAIPPAVQAASFDGSVDDLTLDGSGHPVAALSGGPGYYATLSAGTWTAHAMTTRNVSASSVAVDAQGHIYYMWPDGGGYSVFDYATNKSGVWVTQQLLAGIMSPKAVVLDSNGFLHVAWVGSFEGISGVWYATNRYGYLYTVLLYQGAISATVDIALSSAGAPHIVWAGGNCATQCGVFYANYDGTNWHAQLAQQGTGYPTDVRIGVDNSGKAHIVGYHSLSQTSAEIVELTNSSGSWTQRQLATGVKSNIFDVAFGTAGPTDLAYVALNGTDTASYEVWLAHTTALPIVPDQVTDRHQASKPWPRMAVSPTGIHHLMFNTNIAGEPMTYGTDATGSWQFSTPTIVTTGTAPILIAPISSPEIDGRVASDGRVPIETDILPNAPSPSPDCVDIQRKTDAGSYVRPATSCENRFWQEMLAPTHVYTYRSSTKYWDDATSTYLTSGWYTGKAFTLKRNQENSTSLTYSGTWTRTAVSGTSGGYYKSTTQAGAYVKFTTTAQSIGLVAKVGPTFGAADVYIDGRQVGTVNLYRAAGSMTRVVSIAWRFFDAGPHVVKFVAKGTSGHPRFDVDAIVLLQ